MTRLPVHLPNQYLAALVKTAAETHGDIAARHATACFAELGVNAPSDLATKTKDDFARLPLCGPKTLKLIEAVANLAGVTLRKVDRARRQRRPSLPAELHDLTIVRLGQAYRSKTGIMLTPTEVQSLGPVLDRVLED